MKSKVSLPVVILLSILLSSVCQAADSKKAQSVQEGWMGIYSGKDKVGYSHTVIKKAENLEISEEIRLRMTVLGARREVETKSNNVLD